MKFIVLQNYQFTSAQNHAVFARAGQEYLKDVVNKLVTEVAFLSPTSRVGQQYQYSYNRLRRSDWQSRFPWNSVLSGVPKVIKLFLEMRMICMLTTSSTTCILTVKHFCVWKWKMKDQIETLPKIEIMIKGCSLSVETLLSGMHHLTLCTSLPTKLPKYLLKKFFRTTKPPTHNMKNKHVATIFNFNCSS